MIYRDFNNRRKVNIYLPRTDGRFSVFVLGTIDWDSGYLSCYDKIYDQVQAVSNRNGTEPFVDYDEIPNKIKHEVIITIMDRYWNV